MMGQEEIYNWLKAHKGYHRAIDIAFNTGLNRTTTGVNLRKLIAKGEVERVVIGPRYNYYGYSLKRSR
jgi:DNA-binding MarR family transcriptional regulator